MKDPAFDQRMIALNSEYARCIDDDRLEAWPDFFCDPCLYKITVADSYERQLEAGIMYADSRGMLRDRVSALREANVYEQHRYRHLVGAPAITVEEDTSVRTETPFFVARIMRDGKTDLFATGRYLDLVREETDGALRLAERIVVCDSNRFNTLVALPL